LTSRFFITALLCLSLCLSPVLCSAAAEYRITEAELTKLESILSDLKSTNEILMKSSTESARDLLTVSEKLKQSQADLAKLRAQLKLLQEESTQAKSELALANEELKKSNQSLKQYEREVKSEITKLRIQQILIGIGAFYLGRATK
jgi:chromosome segregation ATPase